MRRAHLTPLLAAALAGLVLVPSTIASIPPVESAYLARLGPNRFPDNGSATSAIRLFVAGRISVYTRLVDQQAGSHWSVEIFDAGTCANVLASVATLADITIGPNGLGARTDSLTSDQSARLRDALASGRRLVMRLTGSGWQTCQPYAAVDPASLGSSAPPTTGTTTSATSATGTVTTTTTSGTGSTSTISSTTVTSSTTTDVTTTESTVVSTTTDVTTTESTVVSTTTIETTPACIPTPDEDCVPDGPPDEE